MPDEKSMEHAGERLDESAASMAAPKGEARAAQPVAEGLVAKRPIWMWIAGAVVAQVLEAAPDVVQAGARLTQARANLRDAQLNLSYCDVIADIDGVVTRRSVNPGDELVAGLYHRQLRLALDLLPECAGWRTGLFHVPGVGRGSRIPEGGAGQ